MQHRTRIFSLIVTMLCINGCDPSMTAYHRANEAYAQCNYKTSYANYLRAAKNNIVPAQYALAYQYYYGLGIKQNSIEAVKWFKRAEPYSVQARHALILLEDNKPIEPWQFQLKYTQPTQSLRKCG